ncbi:MAG TPA: PPC domain-containing DNA-binding protein [Vicinamibacterales bacterium]|nr:PPC domain-containing DNA-binding protein [Vicinamibacterales bacterium]
MRHTRLGDTYLLRLETDEEIVGAVTRFAADHGIQAASVEGIGSVHAAVLGYFDRATKQYLRRTFDDDMEILSLLGNLALNDGKPFAHVHVVLGDREFKAAAGHLFEGKTAATCELVIRPLSGSARRAKDEATGLALLDL